MTTNEPPAYPGDSTPGEAPPPAAPGGSGTSDLPSYGSVPPPEGGTPPPPPPPPSAPGGSAEEFSAPAAIGWGWERFKENVGQSLLAMLILVVVSVVLSGIASLITPGDAMMYPGGTGTSFDLDAGDLVVTFVVGVIVSALSYIVTVAIARATIDVTNGESLDITGAFGKIDMTNAVVAGLIVGVLTEIGFALLVVPGIIVTFFAYFTAYFVADGASPVDGLKASFSLIGANVGNALLLALLSILVLILGVIALCVGIFVAAPVTFFASAYAYRRFQNQPVTG